MVFKLETANRGDEFVYNSDIEKYSDIITIKNREYSEWHEKEMCQLYVTIKTWEDFMRLQECANSRILTKNDKGDWNPPYDLLVSTKYMEITIGDNYLS